MQVKFMGNAMKKRYSWFQIFVFVSTAIALMACEQKGSDQKSGNQSATKFEYKKNGLPCVQNLCIGDGLDELKRIKWDDQNERISNYGKTWSKKAANMKFYRGEPDLGLAKVYLDASIFDSNALPVLAKVTAVCESTGDSLEGSYIADSGNKLYVMIAMKPNLSNKSIQHWTVIRINSDRLDGNLSDGQVAEVKGTLDNRYEEFKATLNKSTNSIGQAL